MAGLLESICPDAAPSAWRMDEALQSCSDEDLQIVHAKLFVGPFEMKAPPYGSIYLESRHLVMGDSTMDVAKIYQDAGLKVELHEPPDHIAIELEFMAFLCTSEVEKIQTGNKVEQQKLRESQKQFLQSFIAPWIPQFCQRIREGTENLFYIELANCLEIFITRHPYSMPF